MRGRTGMFMLCAAFGLAAAGCGPSHPSGHKRAEAPRANPSRAYAQTPPAAPNYAAATIYADPTAPSRYPAVASSPRSGDAVLLYHPARGVVNQSAAAPAMVPPYCPGPTLATGRQGEAVWIGCAPPPPGASLPPIMSPEARRSLGIRATS